MVGSESPKLFGSADSENARSVSLLSASGLASTDGGKSVASKEESPASTAPGRIKKVSTTTPCKVRFII
jgi:hypothetical protein